jgi:drug/metabolite transporter (DMT)-like permease
LTAISAGHIITWMSRAFLYLSLAVATVAVSWAAIIIRIADADPISTAFYRMAFSTLLFAPFAARGITESLRRLSRFDLTMLIGSGIALGLHFAFWITSLYYTTVSNSVILVATQPFFVAAIEALFWKEKISSRAIRGMILAFAGMVIISRADFQLGGDHLPGDILALIGAFCAGAYLLLGRKLRQKLNNRYYVFPVHLIAALTLLIIALFFGSPLTGFPQRTWILFFLLALIPTIIGHNLYNYLLKFIRAHLVAITILGEPIGATILAALIFAEYPPIPTYIGGGLIITGIFLTLAGTKRDVVPAETA